MPEPSSAHPPTWWKSRRPRGRSATIPSQGRPLSYALEQGFASTIGDAVLLHGFDEDGEFKLGQVDNLTAGASVILRDASGRPGWAGRGGCS